MKSALVLPAAAALLLWPAFLNGYPIVFADTGTYLSQAINHYLGWDRPVFYSFFMLPLHLTITTWPVIAVQSLMACWVLSICGRLLVARWHPWMLLPLAAGAAVLTSLPWTVSELSPDFLTALMILSLVVLLVAPAWLSVAERVGLVLLVTFAIAAHLSNLPLAVVLLIVLLPWRRSLVPWVAVALGMFALMSVNVVAGRGFAISPYGNVFLLARVIADGPGRDALVRNCPQAGWMLCPYVADLTDNADEFLWDPQGPLGAVGGAKRVSPEAGAIIASAVAAEPMREAEAFVSNGMIQAILFETGDGLHPWPSEVTPWVERDFPAAEARRYEAARQTQGMSLLPVWLMRLHEVVALIGLLGCLALAVRRKTASSARIAVCAVLMGIVANAFICGGLSGPHDRYQSRVMWLPGVVAALALAGRREV